MQTALNILGIFLFLCSAYRIRGGSGINLMGDNKCRAFWGACVAASTSLLIPTLGPFFCVLVGVFAFGALKLPINHSPYQSGGWGPMGQNTTGEKHAITALWLPEYTMADPLYYRIAISAAGMFTVVLFRLTIIFGWLAAINPAFSLGILSGALFGAFAYPLGSAPFMPAAIEGWRDANGNLQVTDQSRTYGEFFSGGAYAVCLAVAALFWRIFVRV